MWALITLKMSENCQNTFFSRTQLLSHSLKHY